MVSKLVLLSNLLLASMALAIPSFGLGSPLAPRGENHRSQSLSHVESRDANLGRTQNWAGAVYAGDKEDFSSVTGTFTAPTPSGSQGAVGIFVGINGPSCQNASLRTGISFSINNGIVSYGGWYQWAPGPAYVFPEPVSAGDVVTATVIATSASSGIAIIHNLTTRKTSYKVLKSAYALCEKSALWIVAIPFHDGSLVSLADFGTVTYTNAIASGPGGSYWPSSATDILEIVQDNTSVTHISTSKDSLVIQYKTQNG